MNVEQLRDKYNALFVDLMSDVRKDCESHMDLFIAYSSITSSALFMNAELYSQLFGVPIQDSFDKVVDQNLDLFIELLQAGVIK